MTKLVINNDYGGFGLSQKAYERLNELGIPIVKYIEGESQPEKIIYKGNWRGTDELWEVWTRSYENRSDPLVIQVAEELGAEASGPLSSLVVVEIPDGVEYEIEDYDGIESIHEKHRVWS